MKNKFVLSKSEFPDKKSAERQVTKWWEKGSLTSHQVRLYKITEIYELKLKYIRVKEKYESKTK